MHKNVGQLKISVDKISIMLFKFRTTLFLTLFRVGISNQISIVMASKVHIKKCKCQNFLAQSIAARLLGLEGSEHVQGISAVKMQRPPNHPLKCPGMHCSYSRGQTHVCPGKY